MPGTGCMGFHSAQSTVSIRNRAGRLFSSPKSVTWALGAGQPFLMYTDNWSNKVMVPASDTSIFDSSSEDLLSLITGTLVDWYIGRLVRTLALVSSEGIICSP